MQGFPFTKPSHFSCYSLNRCQKYKQMKYYNSDVVQMDKNYITLKQNLKIANPKQTKRVLHGYLAKEFPRSYNSEDGINDLDKN